MQKKALDKKMKKKKSNILIWSEISPPQGQRATHLHP